MLPASLPAISPFLTPLMLDVGPLPLQSPCREWGPFPCCSRLSDIVCPILRCKRVGFHAGIVQPVTLESEASQGVWGFAF